MIGDSCLGNFNFWYIRKYLLMFVKTDKSVLHLKYQEESFLNWFFKCALSISNLTTLKSTKLSLREKCPNTEFFLVRIFLYSVRVQENTDQKKNPYLDTFCVVFFRKMINLRCLKGFWIRLSIPVFSRCIETHWTGPRCC